LALFALAMVPTGGFAFISGLLGYKQPTSLTGYGGEVDLSLLPVRLLSPAVLAAQRHEAESALAPAARIVLAGAVLAALTGALAPTRRAGGLRGQSGALAARLRRAASVVACGQGKDEASPKLTVEEMKERLRLKGEPMLADMLEKLEAQLVEGGQVAQEESSESKQAADVAEPSAENKEAEDTLAQLQVLDSGALKEDYFDADSGEWDMDGLREDFRLAKEKQEVAPAAKAEATSPAPAGEDPQSMLEELLQYDPESAKEDYFDEEAHEWDIDGLREDLKLAKSKSSAAAKDANDPESLLAQLQSMDPGAAKEDYFDEESGWDLGGLQSDLKLMKEQSPQAVEAAPAAPPAAAAGAEQAGGEAAEALWAELSGLDAEAAKEDYFDEESGDWDLAGLKDDLALARQSRQATGQAAVVEPQAQAAVVEPQAPAVEAKTEGTLEDPEAILAHLSTFDPRVTKQDYFDDENGTWDVEGLKEDLRLAKEAVADSAQAATSSETATAAAPTEAPAQAEAAAAPAPEPEAAQEEAAPEAISPGDFVMAKFEGDGAGWYTAVVTKDHGNNSFEVKWDEDSTEQTLSRDKIMLLPPITVKARVSAVWEEDGGWYQAEVQKDNGDGTFVVKYDEDQTEATLSKGKIRVLAEPPSYWAAPYSEGDAAPAAEEAVMACWKDGDYEGYHEAKVVKDNGDGTFLVKWDEDASETSVKREEIRRNKLRFPTSELTVGQKYTAVVTNTAQFGAFVDVGTQTDGLVYIGKLAPHRVDKVEDVVQPGQVVTVWFAEQKDNGKLDFSMVEGRLGGGPAGAGGGGRREIDLSAFVDVDPDTWLKGTVARIQAFGLFVTVESPNGGTPQDGLVHVSNIRDGYVTDAFEEAEVGQEVQVRVLQVDKERNQLKLSMKG